MMYTFVNGFALFLIVTNVLCVLTGMVRASPPWIICLNAVAAVLAALWLKARLELGPR